MVNGTVWACMAPLFQGPCPLWPQPWPQMDPHRGSRSRPAARCSGKSVQGMSFTALPSTGSTGTAAVVSGGCGWGSLDTVTQSTLRAGGSMPCLFPRELDPVTSGWLCPLTALECRGAAPPGARTRVLSGWGGNRPRGQQGPHFPG